VLNRRAFLRQSGRLSLGAFTTTAALTGFGQEVVELPFENGQRPLVKYPQKRPMLRLTARPPQLETPFAVFDESPLTPNDAFFVRYHLTNAPPAAELLTPEKFRVQVQGSVTAPVTLSVAELKAGFEPVEVVAVNQCSGNSRGFFEPRIPGGQSGNGMMGNARWRGVRLKDVLAKAGLKAGARQVTFNGLDSPLLPQTPDFVKALDVEHARDGEVMLAYEMNGEPLPWLNGFPLRLVVPGHYGTYWLKHLHEIRVIDETFNGYWMNPAYRIPDNECACVPPGTKPDKTVPIQRYNVRSFITNLQNGAKVQAGQRATVRGIAFDGGEGIREVAFSSDGGQTWQATELGKDHGRYSFREWTAAFTPAKPGSYILQAKATNRAGQKQPDKASWNPAGYMRNVIESTTITAS